eukprot:13259729-Heterocapsa_arctica.AAC.1
MAELALGLPFLEHFFGQMFPDPARLPSILLALMELMEILPHDSSGCLVALPPRAVFHVRPNR